MGGVDKDLALRMAFGGASSSGVESTAITAILQNAIQGAPYTHTHTLFYLYAHKQTHNPHTLQNMMAAITVFWKSAQRTRLALNRQIFDALKKVQLGVI